MDSVFFDPRINTKDLTTYLGIIPLDIVGEITKCTNSVLVQILLAEQNTSSSYEVANKLFANLIYPLRTSLDPHNEKEPLKVLPRYSYLSSLPLDPREYQLTQQKIAALSSSLKKNTDAALKDSVNAYINYLEILSSVVFSSVMKNILWPLNPDEDLPLWGAEGDSILAKEEGECKRIIFKSGDQTYLVNENILTVFIEVVGEKNIQKMADINTLNQGSYNLLHKIVQRHKALMNKALCDADDQPSSG